MLLLLATLTTATGLLTIDCFIPGAGRKPASAGHDSSWLVALAAILAEPLLGHAKSLADVVALAVAVVDLAGLGDEDAVWELHLGDVVADDNWRRWRLRRVWRRRLGRWRRWRWRRWRLSGAWRRSRWRRRFPILLLLLAALAALVDVLEDGVQTLRLEKQAQDETQTGDPIWNAGWP